MEDRHKKALLAALEAGSEILKIYGGDHGVEYKSDESPLTLADKASHECIVQHLTSTALPILSEEGKSISFEDRRHWSTFWLIDPLDGTKEFIKRNGEFTVNIALIQNQLPVWGVVYAPWLKLLYWGEVGKGAWMIEEVAANVSLQNLIANARMIKSQPQADPYKVVGSRSHSSAETEEFIEQLRKEHKQLEFVSMGSSLKICLVAEGKAQVYPRYAPTMEWDTAAGHAVAKAAGCTVINPKTNQELHYNKEDLLNPWFIVVS